MSTSHKFGNFITIKVLLKKEELDFPTKNCHFKSQICNFTTKLALFFWNLQFQGEVGMTSNNCGSEMEVVQEK